MKPSHCDLTPSRCFKEIAVVRAEKEHVQVELKVLQQEHEHDLQEALHIPSGTQTEKFKVRQKEQGGKRGQGTMYCVYRSCV